MQQTETNGIKVFYPDELIPIFNRSVVRVEGVTREVIFEIKCEDSGTTYTDSRSPYNEKVEVDIAPYIHPFFENALSVSLSLNQSITLTVYVLNSVGTRVQLSFSRHEACFAAVPFGKMWGSSPRQRYFVNLDYNQQAMFLGVGGATMELENFGTLGMTKGYNFESMSLILDDNPTASVILTYPNGERIVQNFIRDERTEGEMFYWVDYQGFVRAFAFDIGVTTTTSKDKGETIYTVLQTDGIVSTDILYGRPQGVESSKTIKACASFTDEEDRELLETLLSSPMIYWRKVDGEKIETIPMTLKRGSFGFGKGSQDIEFEFEIPYLPTIIA